MSESKELRTAYAFTEAEKCMLNGLTVPYSSQEAERIRVLRETQLIDTSQSDSTYTRYQAMAKRLFNVSITLHFDKILIILYSNNFEGSFGNDRSHRH